MKESKELKVKLPFEGYLLKHMIHFIYCDEINLDEIEDPNTVIQLLELSHLFNLEKLKLFCATKIQYFIEIENVSYLLHLSDTYSCDLLKKSCLKFISLNKNSILEDSYFNDILPHHLKKHFLNK